MRYFLKGTIAIAAVTIANMIINIICNMNGIELNSIMMTFVSTFCALLLYHGLIRKEKNKDDHE